MGLKNRGRGVCSFFWAELEMQDLSRTVHLKLSPWACRMCDFLWVFERNPKETKPSAGCWLVFRQQPSTFQLSKGDHAFCCFCQFGKRAAVSQHSRPTATESNGRQRRSKTFFATPQMTVLGGPSHRCLLVFSGWTFRI